MELPNGQLQVPVAQVEMFCQNLDEAYERRREARTGSMADSHLELAHWCIRHNLFEHASRELLDARTIDPQHRKLAMLERRLQYARDLAAQVKPPATTTALLPQEPEIQPAPQMPQGVRALFVRKIQPLLVRSCAATGCHQGETSGKFQLNRLALDGAGHPRTTRTNLAATLAQVDLLAPGQSALLGRAQVAHGANGVNLSQPLQPRQVQMLQAWIAQLAAANQENAPVVSDSTRPAQAVRTASAEIEDPFDPEIFNRRPQ